MMHSNLIEFNIELYIIVVFLLVLLLLAAAGLLVVKYKRLRQYVIKLQYDLTEANTSLAKYPRDLLESNTSLAECHRDLVESHISLAKCHRDRVESHTSLAKSQHGFDLMLKITIDKIIKTPKSHLINSLDDGSLFVVSNCKHGSYKLDVADIYVSRSMLFYGEWMEDEILLIGKMVQKGDVVFDVGANIGTHTIPFAKFVGPEGKVLAFEAQPKVVTTLIDNVSLNLLSNVEIIPKVVCETNEALFDVNPEDKEALAGNKAGFSFHGREKSDGQISSICLDQFIYLSPRLIKIDVEGMEINVLQGARELINKSRPFIYVENHEQEFSGALLHAMFSLKYDCYWHLVPAFNPDNYLGMQYDIWHAKGYNINMLCLPKEKNLSLSGLMRIESAEEWITDKIDIDFSQDVSKYRIPVESIQGLD
jgi:FkbM family methyltransferase